MDYDLAYAQAAADSSPAVPIEPTPADSAPLPLPDKPSIAVLPFDNLSGDPAQEYFSDGITYDIITALSKIRSLFVIARNSCFAYKGKAVDVRQVSKELGVRYVLEGSVRRSGAQLRIIAQLIDGQTGAHLWADRIQGALEDIFEIQDQVATKVTAAVAPTILAAEVAQSRRKGAGALSAYDLYLRALSEVHQSEIVRAYPLLAEARELSPDFAPAYGLEAWCRTLWSHTPKMPDFDANAKIALDLAHQALKIADDDPQVLGQVGYVLAFFEDNPELGMTIVGRGLAAAPSLAWLWGSQGFLYLFFGDLEDALSSFEQARRLDPRDPLAYRTNIGIVFAKFLSSDVDGALAVAKANYKLASENIAVLRQLAICHAELGHDVEAQGIAKKALALETDFTIGSWVGNHPARHARNIERYITAMRKAGLPD